MMFVSDGVPLTRILSESRERAWCHGGVLKFCGRVPFVLCYSVLLLLLPLDGSLQERDGLSTP